MLMRVYIALLVVHKWVLFFSNLKDISQESVTGMLDNIFRLTKNVILLSTCFPMYDKLD